MATKGTGLLMVWADVPANREDEFNRWYNEEHVPERLAVPGFLSAARYEAVRDSSPRDPDARPRSGRCRRSPAGDCRG